MALLRRIAALLCLGLLVAAVAGAWTVYYKEQYYRLWHEHYIQYPDDIVENILWLERARAADFCNPLYALATIGDKTQWERYRSLLDMHLDLKLIQSHLSLGSKYDKRKAYFFNAPWKEQILEGLKTAEAAYRAALAYWPDAKALAEKAMKAPFVKVEGAEFMVDEAYRIASGDLDYAAIIQRELDRLASVRAEFQKMDSATY